MFLDATTLQTESGGDFQYKVVDGTEKNDVPVRVDVRALTRPPFRAHAIDRVPFAFYQQVVVLVTTVPLKVGPEDRPDTTLEHGRARAFGPPVPETLCRPVNV